MNDICKTIGRDCQNYDCETLIPHKHGSYCSSTCASCSPDEVQTADVKPTTEPDWTTALAVRDRDGDHWGHDGENRWICLSFDDPEAVAEGFTNAALSMLGPVAVIVDTDGNNIEADRLRAEVADAEFELHDEQSVSQSLRLQLLAARQDIARLEAENARLHTQADEHFTRAMLAENARLQAQLGDGR